MLTFKSHLVKNNLRHNYIVADFSQNILQTVDKESILIVEGDSVTGPLWYFQSIGQGDGVIVVDVNLLTLDWYVENMSKRYPEIIDADLVDIRGKTRESHKVMRLLALIDKNLSNRSVYLAIDLNQDLIQAERFDLFPDGVVYKVIPKGNLDIKQLLEESDENWNSYVMRDVTRGEHYGFQINAIIKYYAIMLNNLGYFYFINEQPVRALEYVEQAVTTYPSYSQARDNLKSIKSYLDIHK